MDELKDKIRSYAPKAATNKALEDILGWSAPRRTKKAGITERTIERELRSSPPIQDDRAYCAHCPGARSVKKEPNPQ